MQMFGFRIDTAQAYGWLLPTLLIATGLPSWIMLRKRLIHVWNAVTAENLDDEKQARA
jgi:hypothetical protein